MQAAVSNLLRGIVIASSLLGCAQEDPASEPTVEGLAQGLTIAEFDFPVVVRSTGSASIHATVYNNEKLTRGETALAVHGLAETGATYEPLANSLFKDSAVGKKLKRIIAIDLIGHGESGYPEGLPAGTFGQLTIEDNVSVVLQALQALRAKKLSAGTLIGHSMGGLAVQAAQQALLTQGSSLAALGVSKAILIAPVPPRDRPFTQTNASGISQFFVTDAVLGSYLALPPQVFVPFAFGTLAGTVPPNAPTPEVVAAKGYIGYEPAVTVAQLVGSPLPAPGGGTFVLPRPLVAAGAFAPRKGTVLALLSFSQDTLVRAADLGDLYKFLTSDTRGTLYVPVTAPDAVHNMFISNPQGLINAVRALF